MTGISDVLDALELRVCSEYAVEDGVYVGEFEMMYDDRIARLSYESSGSLVDGELFGELAKSFDDRARYLSGDWEDEAERLRLRDVDMALLMVFRHRVDEVGEYLIGV